MHIVSQVEGHLSAGKTAYDLMRATFPAGTLTGAPKVRAMQIISELEQTERGPYGGCVGYFAFNGNADHCITIRTALVKDGRAYVQAGGGWVNDSVPEAEFQETVNKAKAMLKAVAAGGRVFQGVAGRIGGQALQSRELTKPAIFLKTSAAQLRFCLLLLLLFFQSRARARARQRGEQPIGNCARG
jgi:hypothetical protein